MIAKSSELLPFFFVIGRARSGTTLIRTILDAHPNIKIPLESPLILDLSAEYAARKEWSESDLNYFFEQLIKIKDFYKWAYDHSQLKTLLDNQKGASSFKRIIETIYLNAPDHFRKSDVKLLGDKNPVYSIRIRQLFKLYPEAKYIHLKRDHRAHVLSMLETELYSSDIVALAYRWRFSARQICRLKKKHPDQFFTLKYEEFVCSPEVHTEEMCQFLGLAFKAEMLSYQEGVSDYFEENKDKIETHHHRVYKPIDTSRINSWKEKLSTEQIATIDYIVGAWAEKEGYRCEDSGLGIYQRLRLLPRLWYQHIFYIYWQLYSLKRYYKKGKRRE
jgi:hypothetical protein